MSEDLKWLAGNIEDFMSYIKTLDELFFTGTVKGKNVRIIILGKVK